MIVTTTPAVEGQRITKYCGIVTGEAILGANIFKDLFAGIRDIVGGRSATYEAELQKAKGGDDKPKESGKGTTPSPSKQ